MKKKSVVSFTAAYEYWMNFCDLDGYGGPNFKFINCFKLAAILIDTLDQDGLEVFDWVLVRTTHIHVRKPLFGVVWSTRWSVIFLKNSMNVANIFEARDQCGLRYRAVVRLVQVNSYKNDISLLSMRECCPNHCTHSSLLLSTVPAAWAARVPPLSW